MGDGTEKPDVDEEEEGGGEDDGGEDDVSSREPSRSPAVGHLLAAALYDANAGGLSGMVPKGYLGWKHDSVNNWRHCS